MPLVGGPEYAYTLLPPLVSLASVEVSIDFALFFHKTKTKKKKLSNLVRSTPSAVAIVDNLRTINKKIFKKQTFNIVDLKRNKTKREKKPQKKKQKKL